MAQQERHETSTRIGLGGIWITMAGMAIAIVGLFSTYMLFIAGFLIVAFGLVLFMLARRRSRFEADLERQG